MGKPVIIGVAALALIGAVVAFSLFSDSGPDTPAYNPNLKPLTFEVDWSGPEYIGFYMAQLLGYYEEAGLNVTIKTGSGSAIAAQALIDDIIPLGTASTNALVRATFDRYATGDSGDKPFPQILAVIFPTNPSVVVTRPDIHVSSPEEFAGLKIGYPSSSAEAYQEFQSLLALHPGLESRLNLQEYFLQGGPQFRSGEVDALITYLMDFPAELEADGIPFNMVRLDDMGINVAGQCIVAAPNTPIDADMLNRFIKASAQGWEYVRRNPENAAKLFNAKYPQYDKSRMEIIARHCVSVLPAPDPGGGIEAYANPETISRAIANSLDLILQSKGWYWTDEDRERFVGRFVSGAAPSAGSVISMEAPQHSE